MLNFNGLIGNICKRINKVSCKIVHFIEYDEERYEFNGYLSIEKELKIVSVVAEEVIEYYNNVKKYV